MSYCSSRNSQAGEAVDRTGASEVVGLEPSGTVVIVGMTEPSQSHGARSI